MSKKKDLKLYIGALPSFPLELRYQINQVNDDGERIELKEHTEDKEIIELYEKLGEDEFLFELNKKEYKSLLEQTTEDIKRANEPETTLALKEVLDDASSNLHLFEKEFVQWFEHEGFKTPVYPTLSMPAKPLSKQERFNKEFEKCMNDDSLSPDEVKRRLYENEDYKNPSQYMNNARRQFKLWNANDVTKMPQFSWYNIKNNAEPIDPQDA